MVQPNELIIGNWVNLEVGYSLTDNNYAVIKNIIDNCTFEVEYISENTILKVPKSSCRPIAITDKTLPKFGFLKDHNAEEYVKYKGNEAIAAVTYNTQKENWILNTNPYDPNPPFINNLLYIHEIQNVYFKDTEKCLSLINKYKMCCHICLYKGNSKQYFNMRACSDHKCEPISMEDKDAYNLKYEDFWG